MMNSFPLSEDMFTWSLWLSKELSKSKLSTDDITKRITAEIEAMYLKKPELFTVEFPEIKKPIHAFNQFISANMKESTMPWTLILLGLTILIKDLFRDPSKLHAPDK